MRQSEAIETVQLIEGICDLAKFRMNLGNLNFVWALRDNALNFVVYEAMDLDESVEKGLTERGEAEVVFGLLKEATAALGELTAKLQQELPGLIPEGSDSKTLEELVAERQEYDADFERVMREEGFIPMDEGDMDEES